MNRAPVSVPWYALRVRSNFERSVCTGLSSRELEPFLPSYHTRRKWSDRIKVVELPLFSGYLFCRLLPHQRTTALSVRGVVSIVGIGNAPEPIPDEEVEAVRLLTESSLAVKPFPFLQVGQNVSIEHGPLKGLKGVLQSFRGGYRVVVSVTLLQRSISAELDGAYLSSDGGLSSSALHLGKTVAA